MSLTEVVLAVLALAAIGVAIYLHTTNGAAKLAALEAKIKATEATVTAYFAGFHAAVAVPSTPIVADPSPAAPVAPPIAPPAVPAPPTVTISGSPGDITSLLFPKPTAPSVVPAQPAPPAVVLDPRVIYFDHNTQVAADGPYTVEALKPGKNSVELTYEGDQINGAKSPATAWMSQDGGVTWSEPQEAAVSSVFPITTTGPFVFKFDTAGRMQGRVRNF